MTYSRKSLRRRIAKKWKAKIKDDAGDYDEYTYLIRWKDAVGGKHTHDPKISVLPSKHLDFLNLLIGLVVAFLAIFSVQFLRRKRNRN